MSGTPPRLLRSPAQLVIGIAAPTNPGTDADDHHYKSDHEPGNIRHLFFPFVSSGQSWSLRGLGTRSGPLPGPTVFTVLLVEVLMALRVPERPLATSA